MSFPYFLRNFIPHSEINLSRGMLIYSQKKYFSMVFLIYEAKRIFFKIKI